MTRPPSDEEFTELVHASWPALYRTAYLLLGDRGLAEDLVQTALAKTYASWGKVRDLSAARAYARTTLVNTAASWFRKKGWRNEQPAARVPEQTYDDDPTARPALMQALAQLPPRQRAAVVLGKAPYSRAKIALLVLGGVALLAIILAIVAYVVAR